VRKRSEEEYYWTGFTRFTGFNKEWKIEKHSLAETQRCKARKIDGYLFYRCKYENISIVYIRLI
jgi:hypothetical protein